MGAERDLTYYFVGKGVPPSLDPESSDLIRNMVHMDHLVGTLLKERYGNSGRTEPYLAERWNTEPGGLVWNFHLRSGLTCEDGTKITAPAFVESFNRILRLYAKRDELAAFNRLKGWEAFRKSGQPLQGIRAVSENHLQFLFDSAPDGFPEFLAMSFYGFYCDANFENGKWRDTKKIVASGPYSLKPASVTDDQIVLTKRKEFPLISDEAPSQITIRTIETSEVEKFQGPRSVFYFRQASENAIPKNYELYQGAPIFLTALVLSPHRNTVFDRIENRRAFRAALGQVMKETPLPHFGDAKIYKGSRFYFSEQDTMSSPSDPASVSKSSSHLKEPLKILRFSYSFKEQGVHMDRVVSQALDRLKWRYEFVDPNFKDPEFIKKRNTNREYDIRFATVDIGGNAENWVVAMMFCSQIAISFPDPTGRICQLVKEHEGRSGQYSQAEYSSRFEKLVDEDVSVLPLYHSGAYWLVSSDINFENVLVPVMVVPRFDKLRFK